MVKDFQVVIKALSFVRNPVYLRFNTNRIHLLDVKIEMQKINDKQFLSIFINTILNWYIKKFLFSWYHLLVVPYLLNKIKICDTFTLRGSPDTLLEIQQSPLCEREKNQLYRKWTKFLQKWGQKFCQKYIEIHKILMKLKKFRSFIFRNFFSRPLF